MEIRTKKQDVILISEEDADLASMTWYVGNRGYARHSKRVQGKVVLMPMHRLILSRKLGRALLLNECVDHINRNPLDNRRDNLRVATNAENMRNKANFRNGKVGYKGVSWRKQAQRYEARIFFNGKNLFLGFYTSPETAAQAYNEAAIKYYGEFAYLNEVEVRDAPLDLFSELLQLEEVEVK